MKITNIGPNLFNVEPEPCEAVVCRLTQTPDKIRQGIAGALEGLNTGKCYATLDVSAWAQLKDLRRGQSLLFATQPQRVAR